jgi:two-component system sensor histidine kinase HydH
MSASIPESKARMSLGVPAEDPGLARRLVWLIGLRLVLLTVVLILLTTVYLRGPGGFSGILALGSVGASFALAGVFAAILRKGRALIAVAQAQVLADQLLWSVIVFVSGAASSAATSLYGLTCLSGAIVLGRRGAVLAATSGVVMLVTMQVALWTGILPVPPDQDTALYDVTPARGAFPLFASTTGIAVVAALAGYLAERLRKTGGDLAVATERAEQAEQLAALGRLAAGLAHEIRNPLGSIQGAIELLRTGGSLAEEDRHLCAIIEHEASRLNELVGDMLELSRPKSPALETVDLAGIARDVVILASRSGRGSEVAVRYVGPAHAAVSADPAMLRQVIWNLVRNAVQASSASEEVAVDVVRREAAGTFVLSVRDQGAGIDDEARARLFDAFYTTRSHGTGVGLAVVKRIVDAHGWTVDVESQPGHGASFTVTIPASVTAPSSETESTAPPSSTGEAADRAQGSAATPP